MAKLDKVDGRWVNLDKPGGMVLWVSGGTPAYKGIAGSDNHDGLNPERPLATIDGTAGALAKVVAGRGDTIVLMPGSVTITAAIAMDTDDVTLTGAKNCAPGEVPPSWIVSATDASMLDVSADNCVIENLLFDCNIATSTANNEVIQICDSATAQTQRGTIIRNCFIDMDGADTDIDGIRVGFDADSIAPNTLIEGVTIQSPDQIGIALTAGSDNCIVRGCHIYDNAEATPANVMTSGIDTSSDNVLIENNVIATLGGTACIAVTAGLAGVIRNNSLHANGANSIGITIADAGIVAGCSNTIIAGAAGNLIDFAAATDNYAGFNDFGTVTAADPGAGGFITPTVAGT